MAQIKCICHRWCDIQSDTRYCAGCGRSLDIETILFLVPLDQRATKELNSAPADIWSRSTMTILFGFLIIPTSAHAVRWVMAITAFFFIWTFFMNWMRRRIAKRYEKIYSLPETFRPSIPKP